MSLLRAAARTLLASVFVVEGFDAVRDPYARVDGAGQVAQDLAEKVGGVPSEDPALLVRATGAVQVAAGLALATGTMNRPAALVLAGVQLPGTLGEHRFWEADDEDRGTELRAFLARAALVGGLVITALDTGGKPGVAWKTAWAAKRASELADHKREIVELRAELARERARAATAQSRGRARQARHDAGTLGRAGRSASRAVTRTGRRAGRVVKAATPL